MRRRMAGGMDAAPSKKSFTGVQSPRLNVNPAEVKS
jgi:hypothetical protein